MRLIIAAACLFFAAAPAALAEQLWLTMDQVRPYKVKGEASEIVIGNPGIADVTVQDKDSLLLFGKSPGLTNIFIFDDEGKEIENLMVRVRSSSGMLTFQRGAQRTTYNCTTVCEPTVTVGDGQETFAATASQIQLKYQQAQTGDNNN